MRPPRRPAWLKLSVHTSSVSAKLRHPCSWLPHFDPEGRVWVAELDAQLEGVLVQYETQDGFYVDTVAVSAKSRGTGVGRALLEFAEAEAVRRGFTSIYLCTNAKMTENQALYTKLGYVEYDRRTEAGYDRVFYRKALA